MTTYKHVPARGPLVNNAPADTAEHVHFNVNGFDYRVNRTGPLRIEAHDPGGWIVTFSLSIREIAEQTLRMRARAPAYTGPRCVVCGAPAPAATRCTNGRCTRCHGTHCTAGGATEPGHRPLVYDPTGELLRGVRK